MNEQLFNKSLSKKSFLPNGTAEDNLVFFKTINNTNGIPMKAEHCAFWEVQVPKAA